MINILVWEIGIMVIVIAICLVLKKLKVNILKNVRFKILCFVVLLLLCMIPILGDCINGTYPKTYYESNIIDLSNAQDESEWKNVGEIVEGENIEQTFECEIPYVYGISLYTQTYGRKNNGDVIVKLKNRTTGEIIQEWQETINDVPDNGFWDLIVDNAVEKNFEGKEYSIIITTVGTDIDNCLTVVTCGDNYNLGDVYVDNASIGTDLLFKVSSFTLIKNMEYVRVMLGLLATLGTYCLVELLINGKKSSE